jgi:hypothetical protein
LARVNLTEIMAFTGLAALDAEALRLDALAWLSRHPERGSGDWRVCLTAYTADDPDPVEDTVSLPREGPSGTVTSSDIDRLARAAHSDPDVAAELDLIGKAVASESAETVATGWEWFRALADQLDAGA